MPSRRLILDVLFAGCLIALAISLASSADDHGHVEVTTLDKLAHLVGLDEWFEKLVDG